MDYTIQFMSAKQNDGRSPAFTGTVEELHDSITKLLESDDKDVAVTGDDLVIVVAEASADDGQFQISTKPIVSVETFRDLLAMEMKLQANEVN